MSLNFHLRLSFDELAVCRSKQKCNRFRKVRKIVKISSASYSLPCFTSPIIIPLEFFPASRRWIAIVILAVPDKLDVKRAWQATLLLRRSKPYWTHERARNLKVKILFCSAKSVYTFAYEARNTILNKSYIYALNRALVSSRMVKGFLFCLWH